MKSFGAFAVCCVMLVLASAGSAQTRWSFSFGQDDRWGGFGRYSRASIGSLIRRADFDSNRFVAVFDRALDDSRFDQTMREERLNERARDLEQQINVVRQEFENGGSYQSIRTEVAAALDRSRPINRVMQNQNFDYAAERQWMMLRSDLNRLASAFHLPQM